METKITKAVEWNKFFKELRAKLDEFPSCKITISRQRKTGMVFTNRNITKVLKAKKFLNNKNYDNWEDIVETVKFVLESNYQCDIIINKQPGEELDCDIIDYDCAGVINTPISETA